MKNLKTNISISTNKNNEEHIEIIQNDISGVKISFEDIDIIKKYPQSKEITLTGLTQKTFDYFIENFGKQFKIINFWKCPLVYDLSKIEILSELEEITYFWNQKATRLWDLSKNKKLLKLELNDFNKVNNLDQIQLSKTLQYLHFGNKILNKSIIESLNPIGSCKTIKTLSFSVKKILDNDIKPITNLINLEEIYFPINLFTTEEIAWLKANLPDGIKSNVLNPYQRITNAIEVKGKKKDTFIIGKGKPFLDWILDQDKIKKYEKSFYELVEKYKLN